MDKNKWINQILNNESFCIQETQKIAEGDYSQLEFKDQAICEKSFMKLISRIREKSIALFLSEYAIYCNAEEMTPDVFSAILNMKSPYKKSILIGLCHSQISFYQLMLLSDLKLDSAALLQLIERIIQNDVFTEFDLYFMLKKNYYKGIEEDLEYVIKVLEPNISSKKLAILKNCSG